MRSSKKGDVGMILTGVTVILMAAFLLVMGLIILDETLTGTVATDTATVTAENVVGITETGTTVATAGACGFHSFAVTTAVNESGSITIAPGNYTVDSRQGIIYYAGTGAYNNTDWNITYTYSYGNSAACLATNNTIAGQGKMADYIDLIVLAVIIAVILTLILAMGFARRTR